MAIRRVHHLNCGTLCPRTPLVTGRGPMRGHHKLVCHCLLLETERDGLVLVDTGFGSAEVARPARLPAPLRLLGNPQWSLGATARVQVRALGLDPDDVRHIVLTHLDPDHAGGLRDFAKARVHLHTREHTAATLGSSLSDRLRYPAYQRAHSPRWITYDVAGDHWFGFACVRRLRDLHEDVALVPLFGHSAGHSGVAVRAPDGRWLLHAGDAFFHAAELEHPRHCPPGLRLMQRLDDADHANRAANARRLRSLHANHADEVTLFCSNDAQQLQELTETITQADRPATAGAEPHHSR